MRIIFHNPHNKNLFWQTVFDLLIRHDGRKSQKHRYILDYLNNNKIKFWIYLDYQDSSFPKTFRNKFFIKIEAFLWLLLKGVRHSNVEIIDKIENIKKDDIFFSFALKTLDTDYHWIDNIADKNFVKMFHFTHFVQNTSLVAKNFKRLNIDFIVAENDLSNSTYFKHFFKEYNKSVYTLPFIYAEKYKKIMEFNQRINKCLSTGSVINVWDFDLFADFYSFYKVDSLQPLRKEIINSQKKYYEYIDCLTNISTPKKKGIKKILFILKTLVFWFKMKYYAIDIVQKYNEYKMFINAEEHYDVPGIWFVEWMACGSAYIGKMDRMYADLWLVPWVHYIWHDWSLEDIIEKIKYYQEHEEELAIIANNGCEFIRKNFKWEVVAKKFYEDLIKLHTSLVENNYDKTKVTFTSSFIK